MKVLANLIGKGNNINPQKTIKYNSVIEVMDDYLENIDLTLDKIKVCRHFCGLIIIQECCS